MSTLFKIKLLPEDVINKIAAGEVIERPSAAVKELLENAIDAGASRIDIRLEGGGTSLIEISDNGCGIDHEELSMALTRHATSKMEASTINDIRFLGFRGEALASIRSVADVTVESRTKYSDQGWGINGKGDEISQCFPVRRSVGTTITVRNLFCFIPNRLRFLKSEASENAASMDVIQRIALTQHNVGFGINIDGKRSVEYSALPESSSFAKRVCDIMGEEFWQDAIQVDHEESDAFIKLSGYITSPTSTGRKQKFFCSVNGRMVNDPFISSLFRIAYKDIASHGSKPSGVLLLEIDRSMIDVNVHPNKTQIKFIDESAVRKLIISGIRKALSRATVGNSIHNSFIEKKIEQNTNSNELNENRVQEEFKIKQSSASFISEREYGDKKYDRYETDNLSLCSNDDRRDIEINHESDQKQYNVKDYHNNKNSVQSDDVFSDTSNKNEQRYESLGYAMFQFKKKYIISQSEDHINIIDQHAAHERLVLEGMKESMMRDGMLSSQKLLMPEIIQCDAKDVIELMSIKEKLHEIGVEIEENGDDQIIVRAVPAILGGIDSVHDLISEIASNVGLYAEIAESSVIQKCSSIACHASIRSGRELKMSEMNAILRSMEKTDFAAQCNHGRPTYVRFSLLEMDRLFQRL